MSVEPTKTAPSKPAAAKKPAARPRPANRDADDPTQAAAKPPLAASQEEPRDQEPHESEPAQQTAAGYAFNGALLAVPSWLISLIFHIVLFLILALVTIASPDVQEHIFQVADMSREEVEELEDFEFQEQDIELTETTFESANLDMGMADFGDITAPQTSIVSDTSAHEEVNVDTVGQLFGTEGIGMAKVGSGTGSTTFFGVKTEGDHFMYVVDNSNSMNNGKFENAVTELMYSVEQLPDDAFFYVIFYSDMAYPLFYPETMPRWVRATSENRYKLRAWLATVHRCLQTRGEEAMAHAFKLQPDVIYLLGDGAFTDKAVPKTIAQRDEIEGITINTLGFNMKPADAQEFDKLAKAYGGSFRGVTVAPAMKELSKRMNRPANRAERRLGAALGKREEKEEVAMERAA